jgi:hypothetical protein
MVIYILSQELYQIMKVLILLIEMKGHMTMSSESW